MRGRQTYDPRTGQFFQRDPKLVNRALQPYRYAFNNPLRFHDPLGLDPTTLEEAMPYFQLLYGREGKTLLKAFKKAGGHWNFADVMGDVDVDYWNFRDPFTIQVEEDINPLQAAMLMRQGLEEALPYMQKELIGDPAALEMAIKALQRRGTEAGQLAANITNVYLAGVSVVSDGADIALSIDELSQGNLAAAAGLLPFISTGAIKVATKAGVKEIRAEVFHVLSKFVNDVKKQVPDAMVGIRGSVARGQKGAHKGGAAFDPANFDVDAFIVSDTLAARIPVGRRGFRSASDVAELKAIRSDIDLILKQQFPGLRPEAFDFRIFSQAEFEKTVTKDVFIPIGE